MTQSISQSKFRKLVTLLKELFQLDRPDLDFGLYRIMHAKSGEVKKFLEADLLPQVKQSFAQYQSADKAELEAALEKVTSQLEEAGVNPDDAPKVAELRDKLSSSAVDLDSLENDVFDHLYTFFRRYYSEGDFLSKRVYKKDVYAIPYEGEEVKLHWANKDQYYIKTSEYLRDYTFRLRPDDELNPMRVHFKLVDAEEGEHGNVKATDDNKRVFILAEQDFIAEEDGELVIRFEYRPARMSDWSENEKNRATKAASKKAPTQKHLRSIAVERLLGVSEEKLKNWISALAIKSPTEKNQERTELERQLVRYFARNTFDYFIHKDLGRFLRRELDFFIKNEVMHLDDIEDDAVPRVEQYLSKIKVIRSVATKIIDFLAQLEDFQKKLWLKKKFVIETSWCIRVSCIPEQFYEEIAANDAQREEWIDLLAIDELEDYSNPLTTDFLRAHPTIMVDTQNFSGCLSTRILNSLEGLDDRTDGVLFHSENFQALNLMQTLYRERIECIHIDPPYNTSTSGFLYPNSYQHSSWMSMIAARLDLTTGLLATDGSLLCHIDENEIDRLQMLCMELGLPDAGTIVWDKKNPMLGRKGIATQHEYVLWRASADGPVYLQNKNKKLIANEASRIIEKHGGVNDDARKEFSQWISSQKKFSGGEKAYNLLNKDGRVYQSAGMTAPERRSDAKFFEPLIHPATGKPCPVPEYGWSRTPETIASLLENEEIIFGVDESTQPRRKLFLNTDVGRQLSSVIRDAGRGKKDVDKLGLEFPYCHPVSLYSELVGAATDEEGISLDFFAGSGTHGHTVINLNREDGGKRKFLLVEIGNYFDTVLLPRLKKVTFSPEWKGGKPKRLATKEEASRSPRTVKILRLESYEDTLNNLELGRTKEQQGILELEDSSIKEDYLLRYMLSVESIGSQSLLNVQSFSDPTSYKLQVRTPGSDESRETAVDLIETFNYLIGLSVEHMAVPQTFNAKFESDSEGRLQIKERLKQEDNGPFWFRTITGKNPEGQRTLIIWRKLTGVIEEDNLVLNEWFEKQGFSSKDSEFDLIYVNGSNNLENLRTIEDVWKVRLIEENFHRLMFEGTE